jgi:hypothetical protein
MTVHCWVQIDEVEHEDSGRMIEGIRAKCQRCDHETIAYGSSEGSRKRCLMLMRETCPNGENNFYVEDHG